MPWEDLETELGEIFGALSEHGIGPEDIYSDEGEGRSVNGYSLHGDAASAARGDWQAWWAPEIEQPTPQQRGERAPISRFDVRTGCEIRNLIRQRFGDLILTLFAECLLRIHPRRGYSSHDLARWIKRCENNDDSFNGHHVTLGSVQTALFRLRAQGRITKDGAHWQACLVRPSTTEIASANDAARALGRIGGLRGGVVRAARLSPERKAEIARKAAAARWKKK